MDPFTEGVFYFAGVYASKKTFNTAEAKFNEARHQNVCYVHDDRSITCQEETLTAPEAITGR